MSENKKGKTGQQNNKQGKPAQFGNQQKGKTGQQNNKQGKPAQFGNQQKGSKPPQSHPTVYDMKTKSFVPVPIVHKTIIQNVVYVNSVPSKSGVTIVQNHQKPANDKPKYYQSKPYGQPAKTVVHQPKQAKTTVHKHIHDHEHVHTHHTKKSTPQPIVKTTVHKHIHQHDHTHKHSNVTRK